jgi:hypothetical protein
VHRCAGSVGTRVRTRTETWFYRDIPRVDILLRLDFDAAALGDFFDDESKLNVYWPLGFAGEIRHDIAFGSVRTRPGRPFFPVSWTDVSDGTGGLGYFTRGTQRHRVDGRTLANVIAWGDETDRMGNRAESVPRPWPKSFDQTLTGSHLIEMALFPHGGTWAESGVVQAARSWRTPLTAFLADRHKGRLPPSLNALTVEPSNLVVTAVLPDEAGLRLRLYESAGVLTIPRTTGGLFDLQELAGLDGQATRALRPFQAAHARLRTGGASPQ